MEIDQVLTEGKALRFVSECFETSYTALHRHKAHIPAALTKAVEAEAVTRADDLLSKITHLETEAHRIKDMAETAGDLRGALQGIRELTRIIELMAKLRGELNEGATVNIAIAPQWISARRVIIDALSPWPQARLAVAGALAKVES